LGSHEEEIQTPQDSGTNHEAERTNATHEVVQPAALASPIDTDRGSSHVPGPEPVSTLDEPLEQAAPIDVQAVPAQEAAPEAKPVSLEKEVAPDAADVILSLDGERNGFAGSGARLSRKRPVSKDLDQPIQEGDSTLRRTGSNETSKVRGPRRKHSALEWPTTLALT
jgi:hypothetical protein